MTNKIFGIVGRSLLETDFGVTTPYMKYFNQWGTPTIICPHPQEDFERLFNFIDVFVLPGGEDVNPLNYEEVPDYSTGRPSTQLEYFDNAVLREVMKTRKPIIGICRGLQALNVYFDGTLSQHLWFHKRNNYSREDLVHEIIPQDGKKFKVNSMHHQGIKKLGVGLIELARSNDGIIEAITHEALPIFAVQWHPEEIIDHWTVNRIDKLIREVYGE